ncbi:topoisomerase DNA-binding C4 zinc finger domain-containing protein, partial [Litoricolaceae bacterium]|nr:topoisomerase DNA-binding C4 zinc finger domain-containing protein [Litorivicinaceae bacterium]
LKPKLKEKDSCPHCKTGTLWARNGTRGPFLGCSEYPKCDFTSELVCEKCEVSVIVERTSGQGNKFYACNGFPKCDFIHPRLSKGARKGGKKISGYKRR